MLHVQPHHLGPVILGTLLLHGCAASPEGRDEDADREAARLHALFVAAEGEGLVRCLSVHEYESVKILSPRMLLFKGRGDTVWINEFRHRCPGLSPDDVLIFDLNGSQVCNLDTVTPVPRGYPAGSMAGPRCTLGEFMPIAASTLKSLGEQPGELN